MVLPGAREDLSAAGIKEEIQLSKISLGWAKLFTTVHYSKDIYKNTVTFEFFFSDNSFIGVDANIKFYLKSSNGMVSPTYELLVSLISGESEKNSININGTN